MAEGKRPPVQVAASDNHHVCKWSTCTGWQKENTTSARSGPASAQVSKGCSNKIQVQPHPPPPIRTNKTWCRNHCNCVRACKDFVPLRKLQWLLQRAVLVLVSGGGGGGCTWMLLLHPVSTCADADPDLCTLHPDHYTLHLWCSPSVNQPQVLHLHTWWWSLAATCAGGVVLQPLAWILLALVVVSPVATCAGFFFLPPTGAHTPLALEQLTVWWWSVMVVCIYIYI